MALTVPNQVTDTFATVSSEKLVTPTTGNWLVAVVSIKSLDGSNPQISVGDFARNLWTLLYSGSVPAVANNGSAQLITQVWAVPAVQYPGFPSLGVYTYSLYSSAFDVASGVVSIFEVAGMTNTFLTVDSVTVATASTATSLSVTLPTPSGGADCLMVGAAATDQTTGTVSVTSAGWNALTQATSTSPNIILAPAWRESTASQTVSWSSTVSANWAAVAVAIRVAGIAPAQPNSKWPGLEFQLGLGQGLSVPLNAVQWTTLPNRLLDFTTQRGIQYELGFVQSSPTDLTLRNDDGAMAPRAAGSGTATANGTATTLIVSNTDGATMTVGDFFQLKSSGALKEINVFQITAISSGTSTTVTFARADGTAGGAMAATATGDTYSACPIDIYLPYRILAAWNGIRYPVTSGWIERWPVQWSDAHWGTVQAVGIDVIATLTAADYSVMRGEVIRLGPQQYWPLTDPAGATSAANNLASGTVSLAVTASTGGTGTKTTNLFGVSTQQTSSPQGGGGGQDIVTSIAGDAGGTAWSSTGSTAAELPTKGWALVAAPGNDSTFPSVTSGCTIMGVLFVTRADANLMGGLANSPTICVVRSSIGTGAAATLWKLSYQVPNGGDLSITVWDKTSHASTTTTFPTGGTYSAYWGYWVPWAVAFNATSLSIYGLSNTSADSKLVGTVSCNLPSAFGLIDFNGEADSTTNGFFMNATHSHLAVFPRKLTLGEFDGIARAVYNAQYNLAGTNDAITRKLYYVNWKGSRALNFTSVITGSDLTPASTVAEKVANYADYEGGQLFADAAAQLQFRSASRAASQTSRATLGERVDLGEIPYIGGSTDFQIDFDPTYLYNQVTLTNTGTLYNLDPGAGVGTVLVANSASITKYGLRTLGKTVALNSRTDVTNVANTLLTKFSTPKQRISTVKIESVTTQQFAFALSVEVGDVITVKRRPVGAAAITLNCVVLSVTHNVVPPNQWELTLILRPQ